MKFYFTIGLSLWIYACCAQNAEKFSTLANLNDQGIALDGYDPVSYFHNNALKWSKE